MRKIDLQEAISVLRQELEIAIQAGAERDLKFEVGEITLEFQVEVERSAEASGGIKFWVVELGVGGKGSLSNTKTHTVSIPLKPVTKSGKPILTGSIIPE